MKPDIYQVDAFSAHLLVNPAMVCPLRSGELKGERVIISGKVVLYMQGTIYL